MVMIYGICKLDNGGGAELSGDTQLALAQFSKHCLALLKSYDSSTAVSAVTGRSGVLVTVLGHCQAVPNDRVTAYKKYTFTKYHYSDSLSY